MTNYDKQYSKLYSITKNVALAESEENQGEGKLLETLLQTKALRSKPSIIWNQSDLSECIKKVTSKLTKKITTCFNSKKFKSDYAHLDPLYLNTETGDMPEIINIVSPQLSNTYNYSQLDKLLPKKMFRLHDLIRILGSDGKLNNHFLNPDVMHTYFDSKFWSEAVSEWPEGDYSNTLRVVIDSIAMISKIKAWRSRRVTSAKSQSVYFSTSQSCEFYGNLICLAD